MPGPQVDVGGLATTLQPKPPTATEQGAAMLSPPAGGGRSDSIREIGRLLSMGLLTAADIARNVGSKGQEQGKGLQTFLAMEEQQQRQQLAREEESRQKELLKLRKEEGEQRKFKVGLDALEFFAKNRDAITPATVGDMRRQFGDQFATLLEGFSIAPDIAGNFAVLRDYLTDLPPVFTGIFSEAIHSRDPKKIETAMTTAARSVQAKLEGRVRDLMVKYVGSGRTDYEELARALEITDRPAEAGYLRGTGPFTEVGKEFRGLLKDYGLTNVPGEKTEAEKLRATKSIEKEFESILTGDRKQALLDLGVDPGKVETRAKAGDPLALALLRTAKEQIKGEQVPGSLAERLDQLLTSGEPGAPEKYKRILGVAKELAEAGAIKFPGQLPAAQVEHLADLEGFIADMDTVTRLYQPSFTGPLQGGFPIGSAKEFTGLLTEKEVEFRTILAGIRNKLLLLRSGAAVTPAEYDRLLEEIPTPGQADNVFKAKLKTFQRLLRESVDRRRKEFKKAGFGAASEGPSGRSAPEEKAPPTPSPKTPGRAATQAEFDAAVRKAKGDREKARSILREQGIDTSLEIQ